MKYHITITRTLTYEADIEAKGKSDALEIAGELMETLRDSAFEYATTCEVSRPLILSQEAK